jgi:tetratricopeptide (TPR) repeat protein
VEARKLYAKAVQTYRQIGRPHGEANARANLAMVNMQLGQFDNAIGMLVKLRDLFQQMGNRSSSAQMEYVLAMILLECGEIRKGFAVLEKALGKIEAVSGAAGTGSPRTLRACFLMKMGDTGQAKSELEKAWKIIEEQGQLLYKDWVVATRAEIDILSGNVSDALEGSAQFLEEARQGQSKAFVTSARHTRLSVLLEAGRITEAGEIAAEVEQEGFPGQHPRGEAHTKTLLARLAALQGDFDGAHKWLNEAVSGGLIAGEVSARAHLWLGTTLHEAGRAEEAVELLKVSKKEYSKLVRNGYRRRELDNVERMLAETS